VSVQQGEHRTLAREVWPYLVGIFLVTVLIAYVLRLPPFFQTSSWASRGRGLMEKMMDASSGWMGSFQSPQGSLSPALFSHLLVSANILSVSFRRFTTLVR